MLPRLVLSVVLACAFLPLSQEPLVAQGDCANLIGTPCENTYPTVSISPGDGTTVYSTSIYVDVSFGDAAGLDHQSWDVKVDGVSVKSSLVYSQGPTGGKTATASGTVSLSTGQHTISASICDNGVPAPQLCRSSLSTVDVSVSTSTAPRIAPVVSTAPYHDAFRDMGFGAATLSYTTPAYVSWDQPRSLSVFYSSAQAYPTGFVQVDAIDYSTQTPTSFSIQVRRPSDNALIAERHYHYGGRGVPQRLAAVWGYGQDSRLQKTGAYLYDVYVRTHWSDGTFEETGPQQMRVVVGSEIGSRLGRGWSFAGIPRLYDQLGAPLGENGVVIDEGDGRVWFFKPDGCTPTKSTCPPFESPDGDLTTLTKTGGVFRRTYPDGTVVEFASNGWPAYIENRFGNRTTFTHNAYSGTWPSYVTDPAGKQIAIGYNNGRISWIRDPGNRYVRFTMDSSLRPLQIMQPDSSYVLHGTTYDATGRITGWLDAGGGQWNASYHPDRSLASLTAPQITLSNGQSTRLTTNFVTLQRVLATGGSGSSNSLYDAVLADNVRLAVTDARGYTTQTEVDRFGLPTLVQPPLGQATRIERNERGQPRNVTSPRGRSVHYEWDGLGRLELYTDYIDGKSTSMIYDPAFPDLALPQRVRNGQEVTNYRYGPAGEVVRVWSGNDSTAADSLVYDANYRLIRSIDDAGHASEVSHAGSNNPWGNTYRTTDWTPDGVRNATFSYDAFGRMVSAVDPLGRTSSAQYDLLNRIVSATGPANKTTTSVYDGPFLERVVDATGKAYVFGYNALGWVTSETRPGSATPITYGYDAGGNITRRTDRRSRAATFTYDALGRVRTRTADGQTTTYAYDNNNHEWASASNAEASDTIFTNLRGQPDSTVTWLGGRRYRFEHTYEYEGVRTRLALTEPWQRTVDFQWVITDIERSVYGGITDFTGGFTETRRNNESLPSQHRYPLQGNGTQVVRNFGYDSAHRRTQSTFSGSGTINGAFGRYYDYDQLDRITGWENTLGDAGRTFSYDDVGHVDGYQDETYGTELVCTDPFRPATCSQQPTTTVVDQESYAYDAVGNRTGTGISLQSGTNRYGSFGGYTLGYDAEGNLTSKVGNGLTQSFVWNALGQLQSVTTNGATVSYGYDGWGRRVRRTAGSFVNRYLYDGDDLFAELNASGNALREYVHRPGVDRLHSVTSGAGTYYYAQDESGNVIGLFQAGGTVANTYTYGPFGELQESDEWVYNTMLYKGREWDAEARLYYNRARWYDPAVGRFISEDPIGLAGGINLMAFAGNDPVNYSDPFGLLRCVETGYVKYEGKWLRGFYCEDDGNSETTWIFSGSRESGWSAPVSNRGDGFHNFSSPTRGELAFREAGQRLAPVQPILEGAAVGAIAAPVALIGADVLAGVGGIQTLSGQYGTTIRLLRYPNARGAGITVYRNGKRVFGIDWHRWITRGGRTVNLPHYHRRFPGPGGGIRWHRPWQGW